jgi:hypothetical protein
MSNVGRPKAENKEVQSTQAIDMQALIEQITKSVTDKLKDEYETKISSLEDKLKETKVETKHVKKSSTGYKKISDDTVVILKSNISGGFIFKEDRGKIRTFVRINDFDETYPIPYDEFNLLVTSGNIFLKSGKVAIIDVVSDDIEVEDVINNCKLGDIYFDEKKISPANLQYLFSSDCDVKEFRSLVDNSIELHEAILETGYALFKRGQFSDNDKMNVLRQVFQKPSLFL